MQMLRVLLIRLMPNMPNSLQYESKYETECCNYDYLGF